MPIPIFEKHPEKITELCGYLLTGAPLLASLDVVGICHQSLYQWQAKAKDEVEAGEPGKYSAVVAKVAAARGNIPVKLAKALAALASIDGEPTGGLLEMDAKSRAEIQLKALGLLLNKVVPAQFDVAPIKVEAGNGMADMAAKALAELHAADLAIEEAEGTSGGE